MEELIQIVLSNQSTLKDWENDFRSEQWKAADNLHFQLFKSHLNQTKNCSCLTDFYNALNSKHKIDSIMAKENAQFVYKDKVTTLHGLSKVISKNSSEEDLKMLLRISPAHIVYFERYPENWEEIVNGESEEVEDNRAATEEATIEPIGTANEDDVTIVNFSEEEEEEEDIPSGSSFDNAYNARKAELEAMKVNDLKAHIESGLKLEIPDGKKSDLVDFILKTEA
jgi:hypothetical protein